MAEADDDDDDALVAISPRHYTLEVSVTDGKFSDKTLVSVEVEKPDNSGLAFSKVNKYLRINCQFVQLIQLIH